MNGLFEIADVKLDLTQENSSYHELQFIPDADPGYGKLCGSNGDIFESRMVSTDGPHDGR